MSPPLWSRRAMLGAGASAALLPGGASAQGGLGGARGAVTTAAAMSCAGFLATIGVNTHLRYAASQYNAIEAVAAALAYCRITHLRDTAISAQAPNPGHYGDLARQGMRFCLFWGTGRPMHDAIAQIAALEAGHPGCVAFLEGPNEIQPGFAYGGAQGLAAGVRFMADMKAAAAQTPALAHKPLVSFTSFAPVASLADLANHHPYPKAGAQPGALIRLRRDQWVGPQGAMPGKPMVFTEFGYHTLQGRPARPGHWAGVDERHQAILLLNGLLDAAALGVTRSYVYQLFDGSPDTPGHITQENHFGLFAANGQPKPAASALRHLAGLLQSAPARPMAPLEAQVAASAPVMVLPLHAPGAQWLALWQEPPVWDAAADAPLTPADAAVALSLSRPAEIAVFSPADGPAPLSAEQGASARLKLGAAPLLVRLS